jgi:hypothetical protein
MSQSDPLIVSAFAGFCALLTAFGNATAALKQAALHRGCSFAISRRIF